MKYSFNTIYRFIAHIYSFPSERLYILFIIYIAKAIYIRIYNISQVKYYHIPVTYIYIMCLRHINIFSKYIDLEKYLFSSSRIEEGRKEIWTRIYNTENILSLFSRNIFSFASAFRHSICIFFSPFSVSPLFGPFYSSKDFARFLFVLFRVPRF